MLTVKLQRGSVTSIVECFGVRIVRNGDIQELELDEPGDGEVRVKRSYFVSRSDDHYAVAYVENAGGATTQVVKAA